MPRFAYDDIHHCLDHVPADHLGRPGEAPAYAGTDFIIARDGRIAALYLFFDKLP